MDRLTAEQTTQFNQLIEKSILQGCKVASWIIFVICLGFFFVDRVIVPPQYLSLFVGMRIFICAINLFLIFFIYGKVNIKPQYLALFTSLSVGLPIVVMVLFTGGHQSTYYAGLCLVLVGMSVTVPWELKYQLTLSLIIYFAYLFSNIAFDQIGRLGIFINNNGFLLGNLLVSLASTRAIYAFRLNNFISNQSLQESNQSLHAANDKLQALDKMKSRFFSNITHEFRTPLVALSTTIQMMKEQGLKDPELQKNLLDSSQESLEDMLENINDLLTKTKSDKGMSELRWSELNISEFVTKSLRVFEPITVKRHNHLIVTDRLPPDTHLYADRPKFKKILNNLVGNAMKFTKEGKIQVILDKTDDYLILQVWDTGPGIPEEDLPTIFDAFTQASNNPMREVQGTGLGLAMVKDFTVAHGGQVHVKSELGKGSLFTVTFPLGDAHVDKSKLDTSQLVEEGEEVGRINLGIKSFEEVDFSPFREHDVRKPNILLVEDNPQVVQALAHVLKDHYNLHFAKNGKDGISQAKEIKPDLVVSDIMMPVMDGYEMVGILKNDPDLKMIPIILLTSKSDIDSKIKGLEKGADEYLSKPFNNREVLTRVKGLIEKRKIETEFIHAQKMMSLGPFTAGIAHEINNPIFFVDNSSQNVQELFSMLEAGDLSLDQGLPRIRKALSHITEGVTRVKKITEALSKFMRPALTGFHENDIHEGIDSTLHIVHTNRKSNVKFHKQYDLNGTLICNINQLNQVFLNILQNAFQALDNRSDGQIWIHTYKTDDYAFVVIRDNGPGIPNEIQDQIFNPFFTTKGVGKGTGLGLYISQQIVREHGGALRVKSNPQEGTEFTIELSIKPIRGKDENGKFTSASIDRGMENAQYPYRG